MIKKGDNIKVLAGKDKGKTGKVLHVLSLGNKATIEGLNVYKKHVRPKKEGEKGQIVQLSRPIAISNIQIICSHCKKGTRVASKMEKDKKVRVCKKCGGQI